MIIPKDENILNPLLVYFLCLFLLYKNKPTPAINIPNTAIAPYGIVKKYVVILSPFI